jgi:hypothetical protein
MKDMNTDSEAKNQAMHNGGLVQIKLGLKIPLPFFEFSWS